MSEAGETKPSVMSYVGNAVLGLLGPVVAMVIVSMVLGPIFNPAIGQAGGLAAAAFAALVIAAGVAKTRTHAFMMAGIWLVVVAGMLVSAGTFAMDFVWLGLITLAFIAGAFLQKYRRR
ncbi:hypothetical protein [Maricaulis parjimensis]|uniref:hypothetical protein n=1 Tax=Maricaulis parjimensis TaxID=144023 RepID=UPI00193A9988|nr:hypothetical protein [Maricaulis parjimensis]